MSSLTDEQRQRIEANRLKALQKRAAALSNLKQSATVSTAANPNCPTASASRPTSAAFTDSLTRPPSRSNSSIQASTQNSNYPSSGSTVQNYPTGKSNFGGAATSSNNFYGANRPSKPSSQPQYKSSASQGKGPKTIAGTCTLISRDRFMVDMGFHAQAIEMFKNIPGYKYDTTSKKWNFPLSEHDRLLELVEPLRPDVSVGPIPVSVLKVFQKRPSSQPKPKNPSWLDKIDQELVKNLFEFQKEGILFGISRDGRALIADDMGLGKTIQALGVAHYYYEEWPLLIVAPSSMRYSWREAIWKWLPSVPAGSVTVLETSRDYVGSVKVLILSYDLLQRTAEDLPNFAVVIMDESHNLKNPKAARTKAALPIIQQAKRAILLSGTPALSRPSELFNQISSINRYVFPR